MSPEESLQPGRPIDWDLKTILLVTMFLGVVGTFVFFALKGSWKHMLAGELEGTVEDFIEFKSRKLFRSSKLGRGILTGTFREVYVRDGTSYSGFRCKIPDEIYKNPEKLDKVWKGQRPD